MIGMLLAAAAGFALLVLLLLGRILVGRVRRLTRARDALRRELAPRVAALRSLARGRVRRATRS
jgi:hypothetical protein